MFRGKNAQSYFAFLQVLQDDLYFENNEKTPAVTPITLRMATELKINVSRYTAGITLLQK